MNTSVKQRRQIMGWATLLCVGTGTGPMELFIVSFEKLKQHPVSDQPDIRQYYDSHKRLNGIST